LKLLFYSSKVLHEGNTARDDTNVDEQRLRSVKSVRDYKIKHDTLEKCCHINDVSVLPTGDILLADQDNRMLIKVNKQYNVIRTLSINTIYNLYNVCHIGNNIAVVSDGYKLNFVDVTGDMSLIRSVSTNHACYLLTCHSDKLYVVDFRSVHVYSTDGKYIKQLHTSEDSEYMYTFTDIAVSNDGSMIYILNRSNKLTTIDSFGNILFALDIPDIKQFVLFGNYICVDDQGFIFVLCKTIINVDKNKEETSTIVQISPDGQKCYGALIEVEDYYSIQFDSNKCALVLSDESNTIKVLKLR
jgi:DNA-binding beta-propeller fold protein YncE